MTVLLKLVSYLKSLIEEGEALYVGLLEKYASENPQSTIHVSILATSKS